MHVLNITLNNYFCKTIQSQVGRVELEQLIAQHFITISIHCYQDTLELDRRGKIKRNTNTKIKNLKNSNVRN